MKLEFKNVNKYFGDHHVLKDVSFSVESGQIFGYLGRNGAGKTTSIRILMDVFNANSGQILMDGAPFVASKYSIGYLPEERGMYSKSKVLDQLVYFAMLRGMNKKEATDSAKEWAKRFEVDIYLDRKLETLSKGNQQKVQITLAFVSNPDILILDEPFSGLDPVNSKLFQDALVDHISKDRIIIFSSHQMNYIESFCDDIAIIDDGAIVLKGSLSAIKKERGANRVCVSVNNLSLDDLADVLSRDLGLDVVVDKRYVIVDLNNTSKNDLVRYLLDHKYDISVISDYEPSLQDIFIQEVGDSDETV